MRVLIIKTSSLGDIIHTLPALTDAINANPNIQFDWLVEDSLQIIPKWHNAVNNVISLPFRALRKKSIISFLKGLMNSNNFKFFQQLRKEKYDIVIDAQGLLKSICWLFFISGIKTGFSFRSARESWVSFFYHKKIKASWNLHAVERNRILFAESLNYTLPKTLPDYGIQLSQINNHAKLDIDNEPYFVFLHGTTWDTKLWPISHWIKLGKFIESYKYKIKLFWGNNEEQNRAHEIAKHLKNAEVLPRISLNEIANILAYAKMIISVDTGFGHLASALNKTTLSLYGPTDPSKTGILGKNQIHLQAKLSCSPCLKKTCNYKGFKTFDPPCLGTLTPEMVWKKIQKTTLELI